MAQFLVKAVDRNGQKTETLRVAQDEATLLRQLRSEDLLPIKIIPADQRPWALWRPGLRSQRLRQKEVLGFTRELATLLSAGLPLDRSLKVLLELFPSESMLHKVTQRILEQVKGGAQLSVALENEGEAFSRLYISMVRAGEAGGALAAVLERLAEYLERSRELRSSVLTAMFYPAILMVMAVLSLVVLLAFVVPQFEEMFASAGKELPVPTQVVIALADLIRSYGWAGLIFILMAIRGVQVWLQDPGRRYRFHRLLLRLPLLGDLLVRLEVARFSQTLSTLLTAGVSLLPALVIVREVIGNAVLRESVSEAAEKLKSGGDISVALEQAGQFPVMALQMIRMGEETGHLPEMLARMSEIYEGEVRTAVQRLLTLLEPVLILGLGIAIAAIIMSILVAVVSVNELAF